MKWLLVITVLFPFVAFSLTTEETLLPEGADVDTSNPNLNYDNSNNYVWSFSVGTDAYTYIVPMNSTQLQYGRLRILASVNGDSFTPISAAAPDFFLSGTSLSGEQVASIAQFNRTHTFNAQDLSVTINYIITYGSASLTLRYHLQLIGQTLQYTITDPSLTTNSVNNFQGFTIGTSGTDMTAARAILVPYLPEPIVFVNNKYFYCTFLDKTRSNSYTFSRVIANQDAPANISAYHIATYMNDSLGQMEPLNEVGYLTVSNDIATPVFPKVRNYVSPFRATLNYRPTLDLWGCSGFGTPADAVRTWTSSATGALTISLVIRDQDADGGDGVIIYMVLNSDIVGDSYIVLPNNGSTEYNFTVSVQQGDKLYFHLDMNGNNGYDYTYFTIKIYSSDVLLASSIDDWSGVQGQKNWTYLYWTPSIGYGQLNWTGSYWTGLVSYLVLTETGGHPGDFGSTEFTCLKRYLQTLEAYGITDLYWQKYGYDTQLPSHYPAGDMYGGDADMRDLMDYATKKFAVALHHNFVDMYPNSPLYNSSQLAYNNDLTPKKAWLNIVQSYAISIDAELDLAKAQAEMIVPNYHPNAVYEDVDTATFTTNYVNLDGNYHSNKTFAYGMQKRKEFFQYMESAYQGAMSGEGSAGGHRIDSYYAGYSQVESEVEGGVSSVTIPEFSLRIMPMQANQGMGYASRYLTPINTLLLPIVPEFVLQDIDSDFYRLQQILYGHTGWLSLGYGSKWGRNKFADVMSEFYLMQNLQSQYLSSEIDTIEYANASSGWLSFSKALAQNLDFYAARVRLVYKNGLTVVGDAKYSRGRYEYFGTDPLLFQGDKNWYYQYAMNQTFYNMTSDPLVTWTGPLSYLFINQYTFHPNTYDPVLTWKCPVSANISVSWLFARQAPLGDGVIVSVWHNSVSLFSLNIAGNDTSNHLNSMYVAVNAGDSIRFRVNQNINNFYDGTTFSAYITYEDKNTYPHWTYSVNNKDITLTSSLWLAYNNDGYLSYSSLQADGGIVDFCLTSNYTYARSRDNTLRTIENVTTDGAFALVTKVPTTHNLFGVDVKHITVGNTLLFSSASSTAFSIVYSNSSTFGARLDESQAPITVSYYDLPDSWFPLNSTLISTPLTADGKGLQLALKPGFYVYYSINGCAPGYSTDENGGCTACQAGYYSTKFGSAFCTACAAGMSSNSGSTTCYSTTTGSPQSTTDINPVSAAEIRVIPVQILFVIVFWLFC